MTCKPEAFSPLQHKITAIYTLVIQSLASLPNFFAGFEDDAHKGASLARRSPIYDNGDAEHT